MNILLLTNHLNIGGISRYVFLLGKGLAKLGHKVYVAAQRGDLEDEFINTGLEFIPLWLKSKSELNPQILFTYHQLTKYLRNKDINIIHANTRLTSLIAFLLSRHFKIPYISTCHGLYKIRWSRILFPFLGSKVIAVSQTVKTQLIQGLKIKERIIQVIYNGIDLEYFYSGWESIDKEKLGLPKESFIIGNVSRLERIKGQQDLILAMPKIIKEIPQAYLVLLGDGKDREFLEKEVKKLGIIKNVKFFGALKDIRPFLEIMDVFCFLPTYEPFGLSVLEAMAMKLPIIASCVCELPYILDGAKAGILIPPHRPDLLAQAVIDIFYDPKKAEELSMAAYERVKFFSYEKMVEQTLRVYALLLKQYGA